MNYNEYLQEKNRLQKELESLDIFYKSLAPFKFGDKVEVTRTNGEKIVCFIAQVKIYDGYSYEFAKMKNDGRMSQMSAGIYSYESIEKID